MRQQPVEGKAQPLGPSPPQARRHLVLWLQRWTAADSPGHSHGASSAQPIICAKHSPAAPGVRRTLPWLCSLAARSTPSSASSQRIARLALPLRCRDRYCRSRVAEGPPK